MKLLFSFFLTLLATLAGALAENTKNFYQHPVPGANGGLSGTVDQPVTHALALNRDHVSCYKGEISADGKSFKLTGLPTGKYDLIFVTKTNQVHEGLDLGAQNMKLTGIVLKHLEERVSLADNFFNKAHLHRYAISEDGEKLFGFIERIRDRPTLTQGGETMKVNLRRFDVTEFAKAQDDWMMVNARHVYREETTQIPNMPFAPHFFNAKLGNFRVIDSNKDLGSLKLAP